MIQKVSLYFILPMCIFAAFLAMFGVTHIEFGDHYYTFMASVGKTYNSWSFTIPDIPKIPQINGGDYNKSGIILQVLIKIANFFVTIVNAFIVVLNLVISILNILISVIQFVLSLIYECRNFISRLKELFA